MSNMLWFYENDSILDATFSVFTRSKNNEILEKSVLQKFTSHALQDTLKVKLANLSQIWEGRGEFLGKFGQN